MSEAAALAPSSVAVPGQKLESESTSVNDDCPSGTSINTEITEVNAKGTLDFELKEDEDSPEKRVSCEACFQLKNKLHAAQKRISWLVRRKKKLEDTIKKVGNIYELTCCH